MRKTKAGASQGKPFIKDCRTKKRIRSSKIMKLEDGSGEFEYTVNGNNPPAHCQYKNDQVMEFTDYYRHDTGSKSSVATSNVPSAADPTVFTGHEEDKFEPVIKHKQGSTKQRKRNNLKRSARRPRICEQESNDNLEAKVQELKNECSMLTRTLRSLAKLCLQIDRQNDRLLDKIESMWRTDVISLLEAKSPDQTGQSVTDQSPGSSEQPWAFSSEYGHSELPLRIIR